MKIHVCRESYVVLYVASEEKFANSEHKGDYGYKHVFVMTSPILPPSKP